MLEFAEAVLKDIRELRKSSEEIVLGGSITDMDRYRFLMGRIEACKLMEESVRERVKRHSQD
jgi:hypothetical protein